MTRTPKTGPMCVVEIGFALDLLMPLDKGLKLVELLQIAVECDNVYGERQRQFLAKETPLAKLTMITTNQVVTPTSDQPKKLAKPLPSKGD